MVTPTEFRRWLLTGSSKVLEGFEGPWFFENGSEVDRLVDPRGGPLETVHRSLAFHLASSFDRKAKGLLFICCFSMVFDLNDVPKILEIFTDRREIDR